MDLFRSKASFGDTTGYRCTAIGDAASGEYPIQIGAELSIDLNQASVATHLDVWQRIAKARTALQTHGLDDEVDRENAIAIELSIVDL